MKNPDTRLLNVNRYIANGQNDETNSNNWRLPSTWRNWQKIPVCLSIVLNPTQRLSLAVIFFVQKCNLLYKLTVNFRLPPQSELYFKKALPIWSIGKGRSFSLYNNPNFTKITSINFPCHLKVFLKCISDFFTVKPRLQLGPDRLVVDVKTLTSLLHMPKAKTS